jgi:hypothetical protein
MNARRTWHGLKRAPRCGVCGLFMRYDDPVWRCVRMVYIHYYGAWEHQ